MTERQPSGLPVLREIRTRSNYGLPNLPLPCRNAPNTPRYLEDYACATTQMLLAATALGCGAGWVDGMFRDSAERTPVCALLGIPDGRLMIAIVPVSLPAVDGPHRPKKPFEQRTHTAIER